MIIVRVLFFLILCLLPATFVNAQWSKVTLPTPQNAPMGVWTVHFERGMLWVGGAGVRNNTPRDSQGCVYSSIDTGKTWRINYFPVAPSRSFYAGSIHFLNQNDGILSSEVRDTTYLTHNGGISWIANGITGVDARMIGSGNDFIYADGGIFVSHDAGKTFDYIIGNHAYFTAQSNSGAIYAGTNPLVKITDSGRTWEILTIKQSWLDTRIETGKDCFDSILYFANISFYLSGLKDFDGIVRVSISEDGGNTIRDIKTHTTDINKPSSNYTTIATSRHAAFLGIKKDGIYRTSDRGRTWMFIGGPYTIQPYSIAAVNDSILFAVDEDGVLWKTTNSGTGMFRVPKPPSPIATGFSLANISSCDSTTGAVAVSYHYCNPFIVSHAALEGADPSNFSLSPSFFPALLNDSTLLKFSVGFNPKGVARTFASKLHLFGYFLDYEDTIYYDTTINLSAVSTGAPAPQFSDAKIIFDTVSSCASPRDTIVTLTNHGCDTLRITSGPGNLPPEFQLLPPFSLPIVLAPDSSVTVRFRFAPTKKGNYVASASFTAEQQGLQQKVSLSLEGNGIEDGGLLSYEPKQFSFPSLSICSHDSSSGFVTNTGCSEMTIAASYFGDLDFTNTTIGTSTGTSVKPKDTLTYKVYLNPSQKGKRQGYILLYSKDAHNSAIDSIPFSVTVLDGTRILSASNSTLDFGSTSLCSEKDTTITLQNTGCDTLWVTATTLQGTGFIVEDATPFFILKGESKTIAVHTTIDSSNHQSTNSAQISFTTNADNSISPIGLIRHISYPSSYPVKFSVSSPSSANQSQLSMNILADSLPAGLTRLDAMLSIGNKDLLSFIDYQSKNQVSINGDQITITGNPITTDNGNLAELHYKVYLTKDSTSDISFKNIVFNNADADYANCIATVQGGANNSFDYEFICGERTISSFLKNGELRINSISPNPTRGEITLTLDSPTKQGATIEIYDILGKQVYSSTRVITKGKNTLSIDTKDLSRGRYSIRVNQSASSAFVKE